MQMLKLDEVQVFNPKRLQSNVCAWYYNTIKFPKTHIMHGLALQSPNKTSYLS